MFVMPDNLTEAARGVLTLAQIESRFFNHNYIGTEHILAALAVEKDKPDWCVIILERLGITHSKIRSAIEFIIGRGDRALADEVLRLTPRSELVVTLAAKEAAALGHPEIDKIHLLLGIAREAEGIASGIIESYGSTPQKLYEHTKYILTHEPIQPVEPKQE